MKSIILAVLLTGCAHGAHKGHKYDTLCNSWIGSSPDQLVTEWGIPSNRMTMQDGSEIYEYNETGKTNFSSYGFGSMMARTSSCKTIFTIKKNRVTGFNWQGKCKA